jgi:glycosyltransferase involved in cell wall biosynthesis
MNAIDVVIPAFNAARYLGEALASVLSQDRAAHRIIVVDDGSTDGTADVAAKFGAPVEITRRSNGGAAAARNAGIARSDAAVVAFLDADDRWIAHKLARQAPRWTPIPPSISCSALSAPSRARNCRKRSGPR